MSAKTALKAVRAALDAKDYELAATKAKELVQQDPQNYHAHVFLGLAQDKLNKIDDAERAYLTATKIKSQDKTAWQGLISLYEKQGNGKLEEYSAAVENLGQIFGEVDDRNRCQEIVDKYILFAKRHGSKSQVKRALHLQLPSCSLYPFLEGRVPHPSHTYLRLIEFAEAEEKEFINREIGERRTRLGAKVDQVTLEVKREAFGRSDLYELYKELISWSNDDEIRRQHEEKLLQRAYEHLQVLPAAEKPEKLREVVVSARDMVIIKHPFELAWKIALEWRDVEQFSEWDVGLLLEFIEFFPDDGLSKVFKGFLSSDLSPFPKEETHIAEGEENANGENTQISDEERLLVMAEGLEQSPTSIISHRIMSRLYLSLEEFQTTAEVARKAQALVKNLCSATGVQLPNTADAVNITLANALISYQSPRNHPEAKRLFESILERKPLSTSCLLGIGLILKEDEDYNEAVNFLGRALERDPDNIKIKGEYAWSRALKGELEFGLGGLRATLSQIEAEGIHNRELKAEILYRIGYCQWELDPSPAGRKNRQGAYASFLASIQSNMNFAPAYTSLGIYYADYKKDKKRARQCFHKAFELSSSEIEAAERLSRAFADQKEWDLVEAVAQRVVDSGKAKPAPGSKRKGSSWPFAALGVVQINKQQYPKSIVSFQAALRISPDDYHCWVGLGESYHNSGRYVAATKAFQHAETLEENLSDSDKKQIWFARYMLANVKRELGEYEDAITRYEDVLKIRPGEFGVSIALLQTLTESSWRSIEQGLFSDAARLAKQAIQTAVEISQTRVKVFNLWKAVGDACSIFAHIKTKASLVSSSHVKTLFDNANLQTAFELLVDVDQLDSATVSTIFADDQEFPSNSCIYAALLAYKCAIYVTADDVHAQAVAWYNLGWMEHRAYTKIDQTNGNAAKKPRRFLKAAMRCFKRAIELEAGNAEFWNALGVVTSQLNPKVAQHSFVRSLHLNERNAPAWTNLGALYLLHNDFQLANEALTRAQSVDPDFSLAWLGQGLLALLYGDPTEARELITHSFEIANSADLLPKRKYAMSVFDHLVSDSTASNEISQLIQPLFALHQLHCQAPRDLAHEHLSALFAERVGEYTDAEGSLQIVCSGAEAEYEISESPSSLARFAQAKADIARAQLANHEFEEAADSAETALGLLSDGVEDFNPEDIQAWRLSAHLTAGLAHYYLKSMDKAIDMFRDALQEANSAPDVVCLLAQVLWAKGGDEERSVARDQLFDCVENNPEHVGAVTLLGVIALLDADQDAIDAVESDLQAMRTNDELNIHDKARVAKLLSGISALGLSGEPDVPEETRRIREATRSVMLAPSQPQGWMELSVASSDLYPAEMALTTAVRNVPPRGALDAVDLGQSYAETGRRGDALRGIMTAPWLSNGWETLADSVSG